MSISAISSSSSYGYGAYDNSTRKKSSGDDPMMAAISKLQDTNPTLAAKLQKVSDQVTSMKKNGSSEKEIQSTIKDAMDSLSDTEKSAVGEAMGPPPTGGPGGPGGPRPSGPPPSKESSSSDSDSDSDSDTSLTFDLTSFLDSLSSTQNAAIVNYLTKKTSSSTASSISLQ